MTARLYVGVDLASGPDVTVFWTRKPNGSAQMPRDDKGYIIPTPQHPVQMTGYTKMSSDTTNMVYSRLQRLDADIDGALARIKAANEEISSAYNTVATLYVQRHGVADELDRLAPTNWTPPEPDMCMAAIPASAPGYEPSTPSRWFREYPL